MVCVKHGDSYERSGKVELVGGIRNFQASK